MKHMSNEQKANEICKKHIFDSNHFDCCMEMAEWKDEWFKEILRKELNDALDWSNEEHETEKQQLIDNLREVLSAHMHGGEIDEVLAELDEKIKGE